MGTAQSTSLKDRFINGVFGYHLPHTPGELVEYKVLEAVIVGSVIHFAWTWAFFIQRISAVVRPLGVANWFDIRILFGPPALVIAVLITALSLAGFLRLFRAAHISAFALLVVQFATRYSQGEIPHSANMIGCFFLGMGLSSLLHDSPVHRQRFAMGYGFFLLGIGYTLAAVCKLVVTGITWPDGQHLWVWTQSRFIHETVRDGVPRISWLQRQLLDSWTLATSLLVVGIVTEIFAWLVWFRRIRYWVVLGVLTMHIGIYFSMGIFFYDATLLLTVLIIPWAAMANWAIDRMKDAKERGWISPLLRFSERFA